MRHISCKTAGLTLALTVALIGGVQAQQHPGGAQAPQQQPTETGPRTPAQPQQMQGMMENMQGMMGMGGMMGRHMERLAQQLELTDQQQGQAWTLLRNHAKEAIRLRADIGMLIVDVQQLLDTDPVDLPKTKQLFQNMATKEADLRLAHVSLLQEVSKLLTTEQQRKFRPMRANMMDRGGMMGTDGMMSPGGMLGRGRGER